MERRCQLPGKPHSGRRFIRAPEPWAVLRRDCWPASIDWDTDTRNQEQMAANRAKHDGVPRGGPALLSGIIRCGQCGRRMSVGYHNNGHEARYLCWQLATSFGGPRCQSVSAQPVDGFVAELILAALAPSAIDVSLQLAEDIELERAARQRHWSQRLERGRYEITLARRRYETVDPENRLVARTLEREWEAALAAEQALQVEHERELARQPARLQATEIEAIRHLAEDVPALWHAPTTTPIDRQMIARLMLEQGAVQGADNSEHGAITCNWAGGVQTDHTFIRPVRRFEQLRGFDQLLDTIRALRQQGCSAGLIAEQLNAAGWRPPKRAAFEASMIQRLIFQHKLSQDRPIWTKNVQRKAGAEWTLHEAAARLGVHRHTTYQWVRQGRLTGRITTRGDQRIWLVQMTETELDQLRQSNEGRRHPYRNLA
jgi:excisionase family DNA binding protein